MVVALRGGLLVLALALGVPAAAGPAAHVVLIEGVQYSPAALQVRPGDWVQWVNKDPFPHTVTAKGLFDSHSIAAGGTWKYRVRKAGVIEYMCTLHPNMKGVVRAE